MRRDNNNYLSSGITPGLKWLLIINIGVFLLQNVLILSLKGFDLSLYFGLNPVFLKHGFIWSIFTYGFLHASFMHLFLNMLGLFFIGSALEAFLGTKRFLQLYFGAIILGALVWLLFKFNTHNSLIGASAGVMGLLAFFCLLRPEQPITVLLFFILPVTVKPKWLFWGTLGIEVFMLIFYELPGASTIANSAHIGGFLGGVLMHRFFTNPTPKLFKVSPKWPEKGKVIYKISNVKVTSTDKERLKAQVDQILDKINAKGFGSLNQEEKNILDKAKDILNNK